MKTIIVSKLPPSCYQCGFVDGISHTCYACIACDEVIKCDVKNYEAADETAPFCPLRLLPKKCEQKIMQPDENWKPIETKFLTDYAQGWNDCLEEIKKGQ